MGWKRRVGHHFISNANPDLVKITDIAEVTDNPIL